jgi:hypothetical protein
MHATTMQAHKGKIMTTPTPTGEMDRPAYAEPRRNPQTKTAKFTIIVRVNSFREGPCYLCGDVVEPCGVDYVIPLESGADFGLVCFGCVKRFAPKLWAEWPPKRCIAVRNANRGASPAEFETEHVEPMEVRFPELGLRSWRYSYSVYAQQEIEVPFCDRCGAFVHES